RQPYDRHNMSATLHPALPQLGRLLTFDEWAAMDEDEPGELVDGRLEEEEVPDLIHELVVMWLGQVLRNWLGRNGFVFGSDGKYAVRPDRGRKPDVAVYLQPETRRPPARGVVRVPPDIAVEVVSSSPRDERRDRIEKMDEYAAFGVTWYWIVDPNLQSLEIFELSGGRYARAARATEGRLDAVPGCPGLALDLDEIWSEIARLDASR
ncbi:MAG TPA: Uma2 family endonuclease, partial [Thermoanaerobaculia bacterium]|nr:Uma2 family endonuclease [Thermoanaerobaculia bacterium]